LLYCIEEGKSDANDPARTERHPCGANRGPDLPFGDYIVGLGQISMQVTIRRMHMGDIPAGLHLCRLSRWNQLEEDWRAFLGSPDGGGRLAERDGIAIGTVTFLNYGRCFSWLSMMLVHPDARRGGIGTRLMDAALDALAGEGCVRLDATPLGEPLYRRFGFSGEYELLRAKVAVPSSRFGPVPENVRPMGAGDLAEVFARDRQVFGADRSVLLASFYRRAPDLAWMVRGETLLGYCFGRPGYLYRQLGPVVAEDAAVARDLVAHCLAGQPGEDLAVDVPRFSPEWIAWLKSVGFTVERLFLRMCRGQTQCSGLAAHQFAIAGPEFG
jgi:GNAT superfamily N-acetyltransferase